MTVCVCEYVYVQIIMRQLSAAPDDIGNEVPFEYKYAVVPVLCWCC